jgi:hypothetical protein
MSLELLNTIGALVTVIIIAAAAVAALVQLKHLRASNQINAMLAIGAEFEAQHYRDSADLVRSRLGQALEVPGFRELMASVLHGSPAPELNQEAKEVRRAAVHVGNLFEELGILMRHGVIDRTMFLDRYSRVIRGSWRLLAPFIAFMRKVAGDTAIYENFELLVVRAEDFDREHPSTYPTGVRRLDVDSPWPVPPFGAITSPSGSPK